MLQILLVVLVAALVVAAIPVLIQLRSTLRSLQSFIDGTGPRVDKALDEITAASGRINRIAAELEDGAQKSKALFEITADLGRQLTVLRDGMRSVTNVGAAIVPAIVAAVRAWINRDDGTPGATRPVEEASGEPPGDRKEERT